MWITIFKIFIWGGISSDIRSEIQFFRRRAPYSKFSFGEVYRRIYGPKFSFTATRVAEKTVFPTVYPTIYLPK